MPILDKNDLDELRRMEDDAGPGGGPLYSLLKKRADLNLAGKVYNISVQCGHGGYSDIFTGYYRLENGEECKVAVKKMRSHIMEDRKFQKRLAKELYIWSKLDHPRILPLEGFYIENNSYPYLISRWMDNGTLLDYLKVYPNADVLSLAIGIAEGIQYLHANNIVHSDIKPDNVLISYSEEPLLCDFGVSRLLAASETFQLTTTATEGLRGTVRYMSRDILQATDGISTVHSTHSDVWAFGMTVFTLLTKQPPYYDITMDHRVMLAIINGKLPSWPQDSNRWPLKSRIVRRICEFCWKETSDRPSMYAFTMELLCLRTALRDHSLDFKFNSSGYEFQYLQRKGYLDTTNELAVADSSTFTSATGSTPPQSSSTSFNRSNRKRKYNGKPLPVLSLEEVNAASQRLLQTKWMNSIQGSNGSGTPFSAQAPPATFMLGPPNAQKSTSARPLGIRLSSPQSDSLNIGQLSISAPSPSATPGHLAQEPVTTQKLAWVAPYLISMKDVDTTKEYRMRTLYPFQAERHNDLSFSENVVIIAHPRKSGEPWWYGVRVKDGAAGFFPNSYAKKLTTVAKARAVYSYPAGNTNELGFAKGDIIEIIDCSRTDWWETEQGGEIYRIPASFLEVVSPL